MIGGAKANSPPGLLRRRRRKGLRRLRRCRFGRSRVHRHAAEHHGFSNRRFKHELLTLGVAVGAGLVDRCGDRLVAFGQVGRGPIDGDGIGARLKLLHAGVAAVQPSIRLATPASRPSIIAALLRLSLMRPCYPKSALCLFPVKNGNGATAAFVKKNGKIEARGFFK